VAYVNAPHLAGNMGFENASWIVPSDTRSSTFHHTLDLFEFRHISGFACQNLNRLSNPKFCQTSPEQIRGFGFSQSFKSGDLAFHKVANPKNCLPDSIHSKISLL